VRYRCGFYGQVPKPHERFQTNELSFVRPESFKDKTFHIFTLTDLGPSPFSLVISRSVVAADTDLETVAQQLLAELEKTLAHLGWVEPLFPTMAAGVDARQVEFRWRQPPRATFHLCYEFAEILRDLQYISMIHRQDLEKQNVLLD
jgi:hypothetical protein